MRINTIILLVLCLTHQMLSASVGKAQALSETNVTLELKNETLRDALKQIESQTEFRFAYKKKAINAYSTINLERSTLSVESLLGVLLSNTNLKYTQVNNNIILYIDSDNEIADDQDAIANGNTKAMVSGTITDEKGIPLPGVSIIVKGTSIGTSSDANGRYSINTPNVNDILVFTYIGYAVQEIAVDGRSNLDVQLTESATSLNEVVVVSYGTQKKRDVTGSIAQINAEELQDIPVAQFTQKLQGKIVGVQINQNTGKPGQGMGVRIRGATSGNGNSTPLYVVDGQPLEGEGAINNINSDEIESFTVLKDAASSALYGSRASNGVVLITTKRAKPGKARVEFNAYYGVARLDRSRGPEVKNGSEFAAYMKGVYEDKIKYEGFKGSIPAEYQNPEQYGEGTDWLGTVLRTAPTQNYNLSFSDYRDKSSTSVIAGYFNQQGIVKNTGIERYSFRANTEFRPVKGIKIGLNVAPSLQLDNNAANVATDGQRQIVEGALLSSPHMPRYNADGSPASKTSGFGVLNMPNWETKALNTNNKVKLGRVLANFDAEFEIIKNLKFTTGADIDYASAVHNIFVNREASVGFNAIQPRPLSVVSGQYNTANYYSWLNENILTYQTTLFRDHHIEALAGYTIQNYRRDANSVVGSNYADESLTTVNAAGTKTASTGMNANRMLSTIGRLNYNYKGKYFLAGTIRRDGSSRFGRDHQYGTFPSVSAGWIVSDEAFMKKLPLVSYLKLRASYGLTGNDEIGDYTSQPLIGGSNYVFSNTLAQGKTASTMGNGLLRWESNKQFDIGLDIAVLKDRISLTYDYYRKISDGLLAVVPVSRISGFSSFTSNAGEFEFWGHEFSINSINLTGAVKWNTNFNISFDKNRINHLGASDVPNRPSNEFNTPFINQVGSPLSLYYGYINDGIYMTQAEFDDPEVAKHTTSRVGTVKMRDVNGDGVITSADRTVIGDPNPDFLIGFTNDVTYKNFDFSISFSGSVGNDMRDGMYESAGNLDGNSFNIYKHLNPWRSEENPGDGRTPRTLQLPGVNTTVLYRTINTNAIRDASHLTCKNISLGYTVKLPRSKYLSNLRLYTSIQQAFVITKWPGFSPEASHTSDNLNGLQLGNDVVTYPVPRTISFGINMGL
ncbi:MAG TPA: TonB-dependent receptor [Sphingobacteriaceae bacterium]